MSSNGVLEDKNLLNVPGTVILDEVNARSQEETAGLRHGEGKDANIVLVPQPSENPNDPLNWSNAKKLRVIFILGLGTTLCAATVSPLLNAGLYDIAAEFNVAITDLTIISGYQLLVAGATGPILSALSRKYGKRPVLLFSSFMSLLGSIVGSATGTYRGLLAARVVQGFGIAAYESLVISVVGDMYFVHQRGLYTSIIQFLLGGVGNFSSVLSGYVTADLGWKYLFNLLDVFVGLQLVLLFLFCPETAFNRDQRYEIDENANSNLQELAKVERRHEQHLEKGTNENEPNLAPVNTISTFRSIPTKKSFVQELAIFTGVYSTENLFQLVIAPFAVCLNVAVFFVVVVSGSITAFYVAQAFVLAQIFAVPPYNLTAGGIGLLSLGPFVGGLLASLLLGAVLDPTIKWMSRRHGGVYEPEYRLVAMVAGVAGGGALIGWGNMLENGVSVYACATVHGIVLFGVVCVTISTAAYALDGYRDMSNEIFIAAMVFKNFVFYGFSYFVNNWTATSGPATVFETFGGVFICLTLMTIPLYIFGKRYRSFWHRHNLLKTFNIRTHAEM